ncbi:hypothetical protein WJX84_001363 [Apatococcus fuscideae]|uniref:RHOMBOID-like protein n=1 Tax=Apatococcus fuscideae TaxID=2026836 RepID=A0AAW1SU08_9CHLO
MDWWRIRHGLKTLPRSNSAQTDSSLLQASSDIADSPRGTYAQATDQRAQEEAASGPSEPSETGTDRTGSFFGSVTTLASHSYTTGYRTSYAGTDVELGSVEGSVANRAPNLRRSMSRLGSSMKHYAKLVVAEHPVKEHQKYKQEQQTESRRGSLLGDIEEANEDGPGGDEVISAARQPDSSAPLQKRNMTAVHRWQLAKDSVLSATAMHREADTVADADMRGKDRFIALVKLEQKLANNPNKKLLMEAIAKKRLGQFDNFLDHLHTEMIITGQVMFDACTPAKVGQHRLYFTFTFIFVVFAHVLSNMLLFGAIACQIEEKYGAPRIILLFFISALGGSFFSAVCENGCSVVVGASGGCFGMMGLFIADMIMNFESIPR